MFLAVIQSTGLSDEEDVERLPRVDQDDGMSLMIVVRNRRGGDRSIDISNIRQAEHRSVPARRDRVPSWARTAEDVTAEVKIMGVSEGKGKGSRREGRNSIVDETDMAAVGLRQFRVSSRRIDPVHAAEQPGLRIRSVRKNRRPAD